MKPVVDFSFGSTTPHLSGFSSVLPSPGIYEPLT